MKRLNNIPHLFAKLVIWYCILFFSAVVIYALRIAHMATIDTSAIVGISAGVFGGELLLLCIKTILGKDKKIDEKPSE